MQNLSLSSAPLLSCWGAAPRGTFCLQGRLGILSSAGNPAISNKTGILPRRRPLRSWYAFSGARQNSVKCTQAPGAESQATGGGAQAGKERNKVIKKLRCAERWRRASGFGLVCSACLAVSAVPLLSVSLDERGRR